MSKLNYGKTAANTPAVPQKICCHPYIALGLIATGIFLLATCQKKWDYFYNRS